MVVVVLERVTMEGAMDLGGLTRDEMWGIDVGVVERTGRCCDEDDVVFSGRGVGLVGI